MRVVIAPDSFGGTLSATDAAISIAEGWQQARPADELVLVPLSDGGEGLLDVVATADDTWVTTEVAGPLGHPVEAAFLLRPDGSAVIESARACGLALVPAEQRTPMRTTTYGVGQLVDAAREAGATRLVVGLGGSATVDGGAGALTGLGYRLRVADGSGLKIGGDDLHRIDRIERGWARDPAGVELVLLADVEVTLDDAARLFGPQKGAGPDEVFILATALATWADVVERDLVPGRRLRDEVGTGAAGGLGYGLAAAFDGRFVPGVGHVAELVGLDRALDGADLVITGEGRLDATSGIGKVIGYAVAAAQRSGIPISAVVGQRGDGGPPLDDVEVAAPDGAGADPAAEVARAAERLGRRQD